MAGNDVALLATFQKHVEDMRNLSLCKICIKPFYEPFILACGHTYCYSCLASWFGGAKGRKSKKNCPDCRAKVKVQPSPNYLLRDLVHMFINRVEMLPEDETVEEHQQAKEEEAVLLAADRAGPGLFKGAFLRSYSSRLRFGQGIMDPEDNVIRCPECHWELEDGECTQCGFHEYETGDSEMDSDRDSLVSRSPHTLDSEFDADEDDLDHDFDGAIPPDGYDSYAGYASATDASDNVGYYDDYDEMVGFIERDEPTEDDDDGNSDATMTMRHHRPSAWRHYPETYYPYHGSEPPESVTDATHTPSPFQPSPSLGLTHDSDEFTATNDEGSDAHTNYDSLTDESDQENTYPSVQRNAPRVIRVVITSDDDEEDQDISEGEMTEGSDDVDEDESPEEQGAGGRDNLSRSAEIATEGEYDSEDSDIRPPQSSARRMQHLLSQRARRSNRSHSPHVQGQGGLHQSIHGSGARSSSGSSGSGDARERDNVAQQSAAHRQSHHHRHHHHHRHDYATRGYGRRVPIEM